MKLRYLLLTIPFSIACFFSCADNRPNDDATDLHVIDVSDKIVGDSMFYGLACDGTTDSFVVVYPFNGADPVTFTCIDAFKNKRIIGKPNIGDWVGLVLDKEDSTSAVEVINLDLLKGTWSYPVMPTFKDFKHLSKRMQRYMEKKMLSELPDSEKNTYMVPREYGFTLKRSHQAQSVGRVMRNNTLEDDSPVEYPKVQNYRQWFAWNGRLILVSADMDPLNRQAQPEVKFDTLDFISLDQDSLILIHHGKKYGFHRKESTIKANENASKAAQKADEKAAAALK